MHVLVKEFGKSVSICISCMYKIWRLA